MLRASVPYHPAFKLSRTIGQLQFRTPRTMLLLRAILFETADVGATADAIGRARGTDVRVVDDRAYGGTGSIVFQLASAAELTEIARIEGIARVEEVAEQIDDNDDAATIDQSGALGNHSVWNQGLTGAGEIIGLLDNGPADMDHCFFRGPAGSAVGTSHRKVVGIRNATMSPEGKHATFMAGSAAGDDLNNPGADPKRGGAWAARLFLGNRKDITDGPSSMLAELGAAGLANAYIHSNSWHSDNLGTYDETADGVDRYTWNNEDHLVLGSITNSEPPPLSCTPRPGHRRRRKTPLA